MAGSLNQYCPPKFIYSKSSINLILNTEFEIKNLKVHSILKDNQYYCCSPKLICSKSSINPFYDTEIKIKKSIISLFNTQRQPILLFPQINMLPNLRSSKMLVEI